jgi:hypothetical protein
MNRNAVANLLPHLVVWGLLALFVYAVIFRGPSYIVNIIVIFVGIPLIIFAAKIAPWWNKRIDEQRKSLVDRLHISNRTARIILYGLPAKFTNAWAFRIYGFTLTILSVYHLYNQYLIGTFGQGMDNESATGIMLNILMAFFFVQLWLTRPFKKIIVGLGVSWFLMVISYILSMYADIEIFFLIGFIAFIGCLVYLVKVIKAERKFKRGLS